MINIKQHIKTSVYAVCMLVLVNTKQQAQISINNNGIININGGQGGTPAYLVLNSAGTTPVTVNAGTNGGMMMETEFSVTKWIQGTGTSITLPYLSDNSGAWVQFPLAVTGIAGGVGAGYFQFSSTNAVQGSHIGTTTAFGAGWDNVNYMPVGVTNMNGWNASIFTADNSADVIDRFWVIDATGFTTVPSCNLNFGYVTAEANVNGSNEAGLAPLLEAEPWDAIAGAWAGSPTGAFPVGANTTGAPEGFVNGIAVAAGNVGAARYRTWTLVDKTNPLPVDLLSFSGACYGNVNATLKWSTAIEVNSSYFTVEKSTDGQNFTWLANINAVGNSTHTQNYSYIDVSDIGNVSYYRLSETDKNGNIKLFNTVSLTGCNENAKENVNAFSNGSSIINLTAFSLSNQPIHVTIYDVTGRSVYKADLNAVQGDNSFAINPSVANGIYVVEAETNLISIIKRVPLIGN